MIARTAMPTPPPVKRKAVGLAVIAIGTVRAIRAIWSIWTVSAVALLRRLLLRLLTAGDERRQPVDVAVIRLRRLLGMLLVLLRARLVVLRL